MPEGITLKRIIDMDEAAELTSSDYALVDSATGGPKKFALGNELSSLKEDLSVVQTDLSDAQTDLSDAQTELEKKANIDGYYEDMTVGDAEQLVASQYVEDSVPYNFRTTGGSADVGNREYVDGIVGGTVVWNQLENKKDTSSTSDSVTFTPNGDGSYTLSGTASGNAVYYLPSFTAPINHVFLVCGCPKNGSNDNYKMSFRTNAFASVVGDEYGSGKILKNTTSYTDGALLIRIVSGTDTTGLTYIPQCFDLTQMFGSTIADYIYSLEQATAGAGVAWFKQMFPNMDAEYSYHEDSFDEESPLITKKLRDYQPGILFSVSGLASHDTVGFNAWDEEWENGTFNHETGVPQAANNHIRSTNFIPVIPNATYYIKCDSSILILGYDANKQFLRRLRYNDGNATFVTRTADGDDCYFIKFCTISTPAYGATYKNDICINLSWSGWRNGEYEPYQKHSYPLDDSLTLRGIPKLDAQNNLYYDGDEYLPDGTVTRKYGVVDLGTLTWALTDATNSIFRTSIDNHKTTDTQNYACSKYTSVGSHLSAANMPDKSCKGNNSVGAYLYVRDSDYADAATFKAAMSGVMLVYELAEPTTETAEPYQQIQVCDDFGTEEYVSTSIVPVGHNTRYPANLRDKLQHLPDLADDDGYYMIGQSNKQMHLERFRIPKAPTTDGTYTLKATVSGGTPTYTWEAQT